MKFFIIALSLLVGTNFASAATPSVVVVLKDQADLTAAQTILTKAEKGKFVYNALKETAIKTQAGIKQVLEAQNIKHHSYYLMNVIKIDSNDPKLIADLKARPEVKEVIENTPLRVDLPKARRDNSIRALGVGENIASIGADRVWSELKVTGENIVVAGQDTGIDFTHAVLSNSYRGASKEAAAVHDFNWHDAIREPISSTNNKCGYASNVPCDDNDHGTHTIATVVGTDGGANQVGVAPGAKWMGCRNMDAGFGQFTTYLECFEFFLAPYPLQGDSFKDGDPLKSPHVINNSWGCVPEEGCQGWELEKVVSAMTAAGILVVASAGNEGPGCSTVMHPPATYSAGTLSVGAVSHKNGQIAFFSSRGPSVFDGSLAPDVSAPGMGVVSAISGGGYGSMSGTSMAGPHVVGLAALIMSAQPALIGQPEAVSEIIRKSSKPTTSQESCGGVSGTTIPNNTYGYGIIDAFKAVQSVR